MEKTVKGATKIKLAAPKLKYVEAILSATQGGEAGVAEVFRTLQLRLRDSTWTIVFKSLIIVHLMIREGSPDTTLRYLAESPKRLAISNFADVQTQGTNIRRYSDYLIERARAFRTTQTDYVRIGAGKLKTLSVDKGLLRETESVQDQIEALVKCDMVGSDEPHNEITLTAFRLITMDLLELFKVMNEGTINILEHYFEMSRPDAERALAVYKTFGTQTNQVVQFLGLARKFEMATRLEVPKLKHAPTTLTSSLEEYLNDPDFEVNRRQFLAQQEAKRTGKPLPKAAPRPTPFDKDTKKDSGFPAATTPVKAIASSQPPKGPPPDLIDFFESIEGNQQPMAQQNGSQQQYNGGFVPQAQQYQQQGFQPQQVGYNPFLQQQGGQFFVQSPTAQQPQPQQPDFTGAGFGGYGPQPSQQQPQQAQAYPFQTPLGSIPQNGGANFQPQYQTTGQQQPQQQQPQQIQPQQTSTNPFRQSTMPTGESASPMPAGPQRQSTNPFARNTQPQPQQPPPSAFSFDSTPNQTGSSSPFTSPPPQTQHAEFQSNPMFSASPPPQKSTPPQIQPQKTGTNPFVKNLPVQQSSNAASALIANPTGSTNPFRQSAFVNQQTGTGWQHNQQGTFAGFDVNKVDTVSVFPRPGQS